MKLHILLVDDDEDDRMFFKEALEALHPDISLEHVENGSEAIDRLSDKTQNLPEIIFLDLNMPVMSGSECLERIRENNIFRNIKVVICSTSYDRTNADVLRGLGADGYIRKPPSFGELKQVISTAIDIMSQDPNDIEHLDFVLGP